MCTEREHLSLLDDIHIIVLSIQWNYFNELIINFDSKVSIQRGSVESLYPDCMQLFPIFWLSVINPNFKLGRTGYVHLDPLSKWFPFLSGLWAKPKNLIVVLQSHHYRQQMRTKEIDCQYECMTSVLLIEWWFNPGYSNSLLWNIIKKIMRNQLS